MKELIAKTVYFADPGSQNSKRTLELADDRAEVLGIETALVATTTGETGVLAGQILSDMRVVAVTHSMGFREPFEQELMPEHREVMTASGVSILTATHAFGGVGRAVRKKLGTYKVEEIIAYTLRCFGQGMKVVAEITLMAADAGLIPAKAPVMVIAGTGRGADTAAIVLPTHAQTFFDLEILEVVCMPAPQHPAFVT